MIESGQLRTSTVSILTITGQGNQGRVPCLRQCAQPFGDLITVHIRETYIEQDYLRLKNLRPFDRLNATIGSLDLMPSCL
jgi:hypothetical protein